MKNWFWVLFMLAAIWGCAASRQEVARPASYSSEQSYFKMAREAESAPASESSYDSARTATISTGSSSSDDAPVAEPKPAAPPAEGKSEIPEPPKPAAPSEKPSSMARMIVYAARLAVEVVEPEKSVQAAMELMRRMGGFLAQRNDYALEIRIPSALFFDFVRELEQFGTVTDRVIASEDVTEQYADLALRLENLNAMKARLLALLYLGQWTSFYLAVLRAVDPWPVPVLDAFKGRLAGGPR